jgi:hypothetical protein
MLVELPACFCNRFVRVTTSRRGPHDLFDAHFRGAAVISRHAATHVSLGNDTDQPEIVCVRNHRRAAVA